MPELPDVEVFRRYINEHALKQKISDVTVNNTDILKNTSVSNMKKALKGKVFSRTSRRGKYCFLETNGEDTVVLHFGMTGNIKYHENGTPPDDHERVRFHFENGNILSFVNVRLLGEVRLIKDKDNFVTSKQIGSDALQLSYNQFRQLLQQRSSMVKSTLMNQNLLSGIGNVYADEILFQSRIHPKKNVKDLKESQLKKLYTMMKKVTETAIKKNVDAGKFPESYIIPRREEGEKCPSCGGKLEKIKVSGRPTYFCPKCQKE